METTERILSRATRLALVSGLLLGCSSTAPDLAAAPLTDPAVPMAFEDHVTPWQYLAGKYDADGDGTVTRDEYDRQNFDRLDRSGDGVLTASDYESGESLEDAMRPMVAQSALLSYFQADDDVLVLELVELSWAFREYDADLDDLVTHEEFAALADERKLELPSDVGMGAMMENVEPWPALIEELDENGDGALALVELTGYFQTHDDGDDVWVMERSSAATEAGAERGEPRTGPKVGTMAPDFELSPPEGGAPVKLSSFRGKRPVALIFGSYT